MVRSTRNVMKWPPTCDVPSTDLVYPSPTHHSQPLLHPPIPHTHTHQFLFWGPLPHILYCCQNHMGWGLGLDGQIPPPTHTPPVCGWKTLGFFLFVLGGFCFVFFFWLVFGFFVFLNKKDSNKVLCLSLGVRMGDRHHDLPLSWPGVLPSPAV